MVFLPSTINRYKQHLHSFCSYAHRLFQGIGFSGPVSPVCTPLMEQQFPSSPFGAPVQMGFDPRSPMPAHMGARSPMPTMRPAPFDPRSPMPAHLGIRSPMPHGHARAAPVAPFDPRSPMPAQMGLRSPMPPGRPFFDVFDPRSPMVERSPVRGLNKFQHDVRELPPSPVVINSFLSPMKGRAFGLSPRRVRRFSDPNSAPFAPFAHILRCSSSLLRDLLFSSLDLPSLQDL